MGIATRLIKTLYDKIFAEGHTRLGLIVDFNNPSAEQLYTQIGFKRVGQRIFLGHKMWHLVLEQCIINFALCCVLNSGAKVVLFFEIAKYFLMFFCDFF
jgi:hypothetical protein